MRTIILAVLFGLLSLFPAVTMAAPSNTNCKFRVLSSGPIAFTKGCDADARSSISKAVKALKTPHTIREDLKSIKGSAESFYEDHCTRPVEDYKALAKRMLKDSRRGYKVENGKRVKVKTLSKKFKKVLREYARVNHEKATPMTWKMCYNNMPNHKLMQQMMVPQQAERAFVWKKCSNIKDRHDMARCAYKTTSNEDGAADAAIIEIVESYLELKFEKEKAKVIIKKKTGGCELAAFGKLKCAGIDSPWLLVALLLFAIGRRFPQARVACGLVALIIGMTICTDANAKCQGLSSFEEAHKTGDMFARMRFNATSSIAKPMLDMMLNEDAQPSIRKFAIKMINDHYFCNVGNDAKTIMGKIKATKDFLNKTCKKEGDEVKCAGFDHPVGILLILLTLLWGRGLCDFMVANVENEGTYHNRYLDKDYVCSFSKMWAACKVMIIALIAIIILLASATNLYAACTDAELQANRVSAQYGMVLYNCRTGKEEAQAQRLDVKASIRAYFESVNYTKRIEENQDRLDRIALAFETVYRNEPLTVQKLALALCIKETGCGFSEAYSYKIRGGEVKKSHPIYTREIYMSKAQACGIVQVATRGLKGECARLNGSFVYAFKAQLNWLRTHWNQGIKDDDGRLPKVDLYNFGSWQEGVKRGKNSSITTYYVYRYNGGGTTAWEYGRVVMEEIYPLMKGASFGWVALLMGLFGRRRKGQGAVGPIVNRYRYPEATLSAWHQATPKVTLREPRDLQKRAFPIFTMDGWATAKYQRDTAGTSVSPTAEVSFVLIEDLPHIPDCVTSHLQAIWTGADKLAPVWPVVYIGYDYIFVAKGHEDDVLNPYLVEEEIIELGGRRPATFLVQIFSNGHRSMKKVEPSTDWMDDNWADPPR